MHKAGCQKNRDGISKRHVLPHKAKQAIKVITEPITKEQTALKWGESEKDELFYFLCIKLVLFSRFNFFLEK